MVEEGVWMRRDGVGLACFVAFWFADPFSCWSSCNVMMMVLIGDACF